MNFYIKFRINTYHLFEIISHIISLLSTKNGRG